jgi:hypothetical protein
MHIETCHSVKQLLRWWYLNGIGWTVIFIVILNYDKDSFSTGPMHPQYLFLVSAKMKTAAKAVK